MEVYHLWLHCTQESKNHDLEGCKEKQPNGNGNHLGRIDRFNKGKDR